MCWTIIMVKMTSWRFIFGRYLRCAGQFFSQDRKIIRAISKCAWRKKRDMRDRKLAFLPKPSVCLSVQFKTSLSGCENMWNPIVNNFFFNSFSVNILWTLVVQKQVAWMICSRDCRRSSISWDWSLSTFVASPSRVGSAWSGSSPMSWQLSLTAAFYFLTVCTNCSYDFITFRRRRWMSWIEWSKISERIIRVINLILRVLI